MGISSSNDRSSSKFTERELESVGMTHNEIEEMKKGFLPGWQIFRLMSALDVPFSYIVGQNPDDSQP